MHSRVFALVLLVCSTAAVGGAPKQAILGHRSTPLLTVDGLTFKDLDEMGSLIRTRTGVCLRMPESPTWSSA